MPKNATLTRPQLAAYWRAATAAALEVGEPLEAYRKRVMREECGVESVKALNRTGDFDKVMLRFSVDAGDYRSAGKFATAGAERLSRIASICAMQIMQLKGVPEESHDALDYISGVLLQAKLSIPPFHRVYSIARDPEPIRICRICNSIDIPESSLLQVFKILDTHRRRLLRRFISPLTLSCFFRFEDDLVYSRTLSGVRIIHDVSHYASFNASKVSLK